MKFKKAITSCGAPLYVMEMPHAQSVASGVLARVGTIDERWPEEAGISHALEHMVFKGNSEFKEGKQLDAYIEEVGGWDNAWTNREATFYYNVLPAEEFPRAFFWLYHLLSSPSFADKHVASEMQNVIQEIRRKKDDFQNLVQDVLFSAAYGNHPLARGVLGTEQSVASFTKTQFAEYHGTFYHAANFIFFFVGNIAHARALEEANRYPWKQTGASVNIRPSLPLGENIERRSVYPKTDIEQVHMCLGAVVGPAKDRTTKVLQFFTQMIDGGASFPLFQEVRDKRGLCYAVWARLIPTNDAGLFQVYVGTDPGRYEEARETILKVIEESAKDKELFFKTKKFLRGNIKLSFENPSAILVRAAKEVFFTGRSRSPEETIQDVESIEFEEVEQAVKLYLEPHQFVEAYVAPKGFIV